MKAFLVHRQVEFPKTHDLEELLDLTETVDAELAHSLRPVAVLNPHAVEARYPGDYPEANLDDANKAVQLAGQVRDAVRARLSKAG